jgi:DNA-binding transcriptional MerR regulator
MEKSREAFRTISEVADLLDTPAHVLRFWESRFPQIRPVKRAGGRRYYRPSDVALLSGIKRLLHSDGLTIRGVQKVLREQGIRHVMGLAGTELAEEAFVQDAPEPDVAGALPFPEPRPARAPLPPADLPLFAAPSLPEPDLPERDLPAPGVPDRPSPAAIAARLRALRAGAVPDHAALSALAMRLRALRERVAEAAEREG